MRNKTTQQIIRLIKKAKRPITAQTIGEKVGLTAVNVRVGIHNLRVEGLPIGSLSRPRGGFFWATRPQQLDHTIAHFKSRLSSMRTALGGVMVARRRLRK